MKRTRLRTTAMSTAAAVALPLSLGVMAPQAFAAPTPSTPTSASTPASPTASVSPSPSPTAGAAVPFGPGCSSLLRKGIGGSFARMATQPAATALAENTHLSTFVALVKKAGLADKLNTTKDISVFAPTNDAFAKLSKAQLDGIRNNEAQLRKILNYHVTEKKIAPDQLPNGVFKTLEGGTLTTSGSDQSFKVNGTTNIVCGDVRTKNATVYVIDTVLMPPS
ncbi:MULTISPECIES: fasciclin domain-containing protein [unclassified Streptomyces]|uniref:fasciclin domain-containing protein n=1 Tax=unclassified Streptomyces TaxID=2593676 RepID=UPI00081E0DA1|nr:MULTISPECIES: fasciclin domain-containing protein [unclassified Streptomyces]MYZ39108.1 fasciclin domain-containing protein [Streptomyces sp. SID4917]SCG02192.1 Uncaracterized surface protein containing fasciclin (FAS1) repeats [Streptomyces sp. MnatMP-M17]